MKLKLSPFSGIPYEIKTFTTDKSSAGTSAEVYIQIYGKETCTLQKNLCSGKNDRSGKFKRGSEDYFIVEVRVVSPWCIVNIFVRKYAYSFISDWF